MSSKPIQPKSLPASSSEVRVYDCEIRLKFRVIEEEQVLGDREECLETLLDAFSHGADDYLEPLQVDVNVQEISDLEASPQMRRRLIRLRNAQDMV